MSDETPAPARGLRDVVDVTDLALVLRHLRRREARLRGGAQRSYRDLAEQTGWSLGIIGGYLSGKILPPTDRFDELVRVLGATPQEMGELATARDRVEERRRRAVPAAAAAAPVPAQLPADAAGFVGRTSVLSHVDALTGADGGAVVPVLALTGAAGVGKTALAVRWAHRARSRFPDGQLFVNLRGYAPEPPLRPVDALGGILRALGVPAGQVPDDVHEAAGLYRTLLTGRRMLVLLDNARNPDQVRPLLPGAPGCAVVVTSRDQLLGLLARDGAHGIGLDVLTGAEAHALLLAALGEARVRAEPEAVAGLVRACGRLPLALRIAAANLLGRPHLAVADYLHRLTGADRLSGLEIDGDPETAVRRAFELSYRALPAAARRTFRLLGLAPGTDLAEAAVPALTGEDADAVAQAVELLHAAHLVSRPAPGRVALHDLLRCYAVERGDAESDPAERDAAAGRLYDWYEAHASAASQRLYPERLRLPATGRPAPAAFDSAGAALAWLEAERTPVLAAVRHAAELGRPEMTWRLADALRGYASQCLPTLSWVELSEAAIAAAEAAGDPYGRAAGHLSMAEARWRQGDYEAAAASYRALAEVSRAAGWLAGEAAAEGNLGTVCRLTGRLDDAVRHLSRSLLLNESGGRVAGQAAALGSLGVVYRERGDLPAAVEHLTRAQALFRAAGSVGGEAIAVDNLGETYLAQGRTGDARDSLDAALAAFRQVGSRVNEAIALRGLASAALAAGDPAGALRLAERAYQLSTETTDQRVEIDVLNTLGAVKAALGRDDAAGLHQRALRLARATGNRYPEAEALAGLAELHHRAGAPEAAAWARQALGLAERCGYRLIAARTRLLLEPLTEPEGSRP
ncbi:ATP-binding protein [Spirilliplanes yamanashiensis]|uniref:ATP-binding protein n=1 Tax=Spirilliplanes yamanashiensis TaxID=42233 RepID=UPI0019500619|nr:tetratricopeptide repeat protein [Spirilliplanes yamanashiensis]MDP9815730.1 tetratricopeptide (TPR) repeat protein [Spirilliplanes yamanashiensis]